MVDEGIFKIPAFNCQCSNEFTGKFCETKCGGEIPLGKNLRNGVTGLITSPNYPNFYKNSVNCHFYFSGNYQKIKFKILNIEFRDVNDGIMIYDGMESTVKIFRQNNQHEVFGSEFEIESNFVGISFFSSSESSQKVVDAGRFVILYEAGFAEGNQTSIEPPFDPKLWWLQQTDQDKNEKLQIYEKQLQTLKKLTSIDLIKEYELHKNIFESRRNSKNSNETNPHTWQSKKLISQSSKYEIFIQIYKSNRIFKNFFEKSSKSESNSMIELIENIEFILQDWVDDEILKNKLNSQTILTVEFVKFSKVKCVCRNWCNFENQRSIIAENFYHPSFTQEIILDFNLIAYPKIDLQKFTTNYLLEEFGIEEGKIFVENKSQNLEHERRIETAAKMTSGMKWSIFVCLMFMVSSGGTFYLMAKHGMIVYELNSGVSQSNEETQTTGINCLPDYLRDHPVIEKISFLLNSLATHIQTVLKSQMLLDFSKNAIKTLNPVANLNKLYSHLEANLRKIYTKNQRASAYKVSSNK